jgi:ketosteroid isomerase-like protein
MRRVSAIVCLAIVFPLVANAQRRADSTRIAAEVLAATDSFFAAAGRADIHALIALFEPGLHADIGALQTREEFETTYRGIYAVLQRVEFTRKRTDARVLAPNVAFVASEGPWRLIGKDGNVPESGVGAWTFVWRKDKGRWKIVNMHQSMAPSSK